MPHGDRKMSLKHIPRNGSEATNAGIDCALELSLKEDDE
jgi:hypothetical protein